MKTLMMAFSAVTLLFTAAVQAQGMGPVASACKAEMEKFCAGKAHVRREIRMCLEQKKAELSEGCKAALDATGPGKGRSGGGPGMMGPGPQGGAGPTPVTPPAAEQPKTK